VPLSRTQRPDFAYLHTELRRRSVTRLLLWEEYKSAHPDGWQYSVFCEQYRRWLSTQELVLRQEHAPGDKLFVDYAGQTVPIKDRHTGKSRAAQIFCRRARLFQLHTCGGDSLTRRRRLVRRARSSVAVFWWRAARHRAGQPQERASPKLHRYDPDINRAYQDFAEHYQLAVLPARVRKPRDKAKVESGVLVVERWILARLRNQDFLLVG